MKRIVHYITLAAFIATSGYTLPMQQLGGLGIFSTIASTFKQSFGKYARAATAAAALYSAYHAYTSTAQRPEWRAQSKELENINEQIDYAKYRRPNISYLKEASELVISIKYLSKYDTDYEWYCKNSALIIYKKLNRANENCYQYITLSLPIGVHKACMQLIEANETLTATNIVTALNRFQYSERVINRIASTITKLRLGKNDKSIDALNQELSAAQKRLFWGNTANLIQYYFTEYKSPCLKGALVGGLAYTAWQYSPYL